jgi:hypothetical protein
LKNLRQKAYTPAERWQPRFNHQTAPVSPWNSIGSPAGSAGSASNIG